MFSFCMDDYGNPYIFDENATVSDCDECNDDELIVETLWEIRN